MPTAESVLFEAQSFFVAFQYVKFTYRFTVLNSTNYQRLSMSKA